MKVKDLVEKLIGINQELDVVVLETDTRSSKFGWFTPVIHLGWLEGNRNSSFYFSAPDGEAKNVVRIGPNMQEVREFLDDD